MITVLCCTYGRPRQLEEMLACFLRQDHYDCRLIILNDCPWQRLVFSDPRVTIVNRDQRFQSLGEKRQFLLSGAPAGLVTQWDDDDIYLPGYLTYSLDLLERHRTRCSKHTRLWLDGGHRMYRIAGAAWMNTVLAEKQILLDCGGYDSVPSDTCVGLVHRLLKAGHLCGPAQWDGAAPAFIYRQNNGRHHISAGRPDRAYTDMFCNADPETGDIQLLPHWKDDYVARAAASWSAVEAMV